MGPFLLVPSYQLCCHAQNPSVLGACEIGLTWFDTCPRSDQDGRGHPEEVSQPAKSIEPLQTAG